ncbi:MAG: hypothetical protein HY791_00610 [Deltaproteobacteria bacterium]|nr:hypothetical protein [Deltaproteobacteria bacterium]
MRSIAWWLSLAGCLAGCASDVSLGFPGFEPGARGLILLTQTEDGQRAEALDPRMDSALARLTVTDASGFAIYAMVYPHSLESLSLAPGPLPLDESGRLLPEPMSSWVVTGTDREWHPLEDRPRETKGVRVQVTPAHDGGVRQVEVGTAFACALLGGGDVSCWGSNQAGRLGRDEPTASALPLRVEGVRGAVDLRSKGGMSCVRLESRGAVCWGSGYLGRGSNLDGAVPRPVTGLSDVAILTNSDAHGCALRTSGETDCWGQNGSRAVAVGTIEEVLEPQRVEVRAASELVVGSGYSCTITVDGSVWCWGIFGGPVPTEIPALGKATELVGGSAHICARRADRSLWCLGSNDRGQISESGPAQIDTPLESDLSGRPGRLLANGYVTCLLDGPNSACVGRSTGLRLEHEPLSDQTYLARVKYVGAGEQANACVVLQNDDVECWGLRTQGVVGGLVALHPEPIDALEIADATSVTAGPLSTCVRRRRQPMSCFGINSFEALLRGAGPAISVPTPVASDLAQITISDSVACTRTATPTGQVSCWGSNAHGQLGIGTLGGSSEVATPIPDLAGAVDIGVNNFVACAVSLDGRLLCWGSNNYGQLGIDPDETISRLTPTEVALADVVEAEVGFEHTCAIVGPERELFCWGGNIDGQLGIGRLGSAVFPESTGLRDVAEVSTGGYHSCARLESGEVLCFGANAFGQIGDNSRLDRHSPTPVGIHDAIAIAAGESHSCAVRAGGTVECFGSNAQGQLGIGATATVRTPTPVPGIEDAIDVAAGREHTCVVRRSGTVTCFGFDTWGQLGIGTDVMAQSPEPISGLQ